MTPVAQPLRFGERKESAIGLTSLRRIPVTFPDRPTGV